MTAQIKQVQIDLALRGLYSGAIDGIAGAKTWRGIAELAKRGFYHGAIDGIAGAKTWNALANALDAPTLLTTIKGIPIFKTADRICFVAGMTIDADGSPRAYAPVGSGLETLDDLSNAGRPGRWWGFATTGKNGSGEGYIQSENDPCPGYYVSTTALQYYKFAVNDPRRYVDSEKIPFVVLSSHIPDIPVLGARCRATNLANGNVSGAVYADVGGDRVGEGSIALANALGINSDARHGGASGGVLYEVFLN